MIDSSPFSFAPAQARKGRVSRRLGTAAVAVVIALIVGCAAPPPQPAGPPPSESARRAETLADSGRPLAAVRIYRDLAAEAEARGEPAARQRWRLRLIEILFAHGYPELALEWHRKLDSAPVPPKLAMRKQIVDAQAAVARRQGIRALRLAPPITPDMPAALRARILATRADAYRLTGQPARALVKRVQRASLLTSPGAIERNHEEIWATLQTIPIDRLDRLAELGDAPVVRGWAELAQTVRSARLGQRSVSAALSDWRQRFADHPAASRFVATLRERVVAEMAYPRRIALLLPLSGPLSGPASAIRDGFLAAWYAQPEYVQRPRIVIHDTGTNGSSAAAAYDKAVAKGASFVVGPLGKEAVANLAARWSLEVPVLALNYLPEKTTGNAAGEADSSPENLYQFGLLPEDEARQAAEAAIQNNHFNALVLVPTGQWGDRMLQAFRDRFEALGGIVVESAHYDPEKTDYGDTLQELLNLRASYAREWRVQSTIGQNTRFEARRRQDVEMIFVAAMPRQARLINPQLEFHRAAKVPTYATSHIFAGTPNPDADWDMNGLYFTGIPWIIENLENPEDPESASTGALYRRIAENWPVRHKRYPRLYALGIDAFSILPHLGRMDSNPARGLTGRTGRLTLDEHGRIHRHLRWAHIQGGRPHPVPRPEAKQDAPSVEELAGESQ